MVRNSEIIKVLTEATQLLQQKGWNKYLMSCDAGGKICGIDSDLASSYCLSGALVEAWRTIDPHNEGFYFKFFEKKFSQILRDKYDYNNTYTRWNDDVATSGEDAVKLIQTVIASLLAGDGDARVEMPINREVYGIERQEEPHE